MSFLLASAARATTGARSGQEDAFRLWPAEGVAKPRGEEGGLLAVLADGMGGHTGGAIAGQTACATFAEAFAGAGSPYDERLQSALQASNEALAKGVEQNAALKGMGCTLVAAWMDTLGLRWASVGDSLLLLYRFPDVMRLNADHSLGSFLDEQARQNRISFSEAKQHHNRNALRSALTGSKIDLIDLRGEPLELRAGDWILLASDGLCSLEGDEIADVVYKFRQATPAEMADGLIAAVVKKAVAGQDNATVVAVRVDAAPEGAAEDVVTTRVVRRGDEEQELRSRRIGITGRKTVPPRASAARSVRSAVWLVAAAVFFLFFAATILMRSLQSSTPSPQAVVPLTPKPAAVAIPDPATPDTPGPANPDAAKAPAPPRAEPPRGTPKASAPEAIPPPPASGPRPPVPQRATPSRPPQTAPPSSQPISPPPTQGGQSGEIQEDRASRTSKVRQRDDSESRSHRPRRRERHQRDTAKKEASKDAVKEDLKNALKTVPKEAPKEVPKQAPRDQLPWGFGGE